jgi:hypothetical protein
MLRRISSREQEFLARGSSSGEVVVFWQDLRVHLQDAMLGLTAEDLGRQYVHPRRGGITGLVILIIVACHTAEHLGQLTRDLLFGLHVG